MNMGTVKCTKCAQISVRNIHNKCIYCGEPFEEEYHVSDSERAERIEQIESTTERLRMEVEIEKAREEEREKSTRHVYINPHSLN